jgi:cellulose synthase/poly-beta-1,6-N-acetylglucosamine synthase-like glycosyltransferase
MGRFRVDTVNSSGPEEGGASMAMILLVLFTLLCFLLRFTRLFVGIYANITYKPIPIPKSPTFTPKDVTVVIPTVFKCQVSLAECIGRVSACGPSEIFVVVLDSNVSACRALCDVNNFNNVTVLGVPRLGKRTQMVRALEHIQTRIIVWADDDVFWPTDYLEHLVAIFEDPKVGAGGTCQRVRRHARTSWAPCSLIHCLGQNYLQRRVFNNIASNAIDRSISTLSGRSAAYRTEILKNEAFISEFQNGHFMGKKLDSDDDKFLSRWVVSTPRSRDLSRGKHVKPEDCWEIAIQTAVFLETTLEEDWKYIHQCLRWARARFRGNFTVMRNETYWRSRKYAWGCYIIYFSMFQNPSLFIDIGFAYLLSKILAPCSPETQSLCWALFLAWVLFTKMVRMIPYFCRHPQDMVHIPMLIAFGYFHSLLNIYALCTLTQTAWGGKDIAALSKVQPEKDETAPLLDPQTVSDGQVSDSPSSS